MQCQRSILQRSHKFQHCLWDGAQAPEEAMSLQEGLDAGRAEDDHMHDPNDAGPSLAYVLLCPFGAKRRDEGTTMSPSARNDDASPSRCINHQGA